MDHIPHLTVSVDRKTHEKLLSIAKSCQSCGADSPDVRGGICANCRASAIGVAPQTYRWKAVKDTVLDESTNALLADVYDGTPGYDTNHIVAAKYARILASSPDLLDAVKDLLSGWKYIRETYGDLYGVGWDRAQSKAEKAINKALGE